MALGLNQIINVKWLEPYRSVCCGTKEVCEE